MNVYLADGGRDQLPGDLLARCVLRSDLVPVPRSLELTAQIKDDLEARLKEGAMIWAGRERLKYRIVKAERVKLGGMIQGGEDVAALSITALLESCVGVTFRRPRAVIREQASLGGLFRACGATVAIGDDVTVARFACFAGQVPSFYLAQVIQEAGAVPVLRDERLHLIRLADLFRQPALTGIGQSDSTDLTESEFLQRHEIPAFYSVDAAGAFVFGDFAKPRAVAFQPHADELVLRNMSRVLVQKHVLRTQLSEQVNAGDLLDINGRKLVVITATHFLERQEGDVEATSTFWLGEIA